MINKRPKMSYGLGFGFLILIMIFGFQNCSNFSSTNFANQSQATQDLAVKDSSNDKNITPIGIQTLSSGASSFVNTPPLADWTTSRLVLPTYGAYSFETLLTDRFWFGGWVSANDVTDYFTQLNNGAKPESIYGPDKIFVTTDAFDVKATALKTKLSFALLGYHVNDPSLIAPPSTDGVNRSGWLYMYFTMLDNRLAERCRQSGLDVLQCPYIFEGHDIGMASSVDGGLTWTYRGIGIRAVDSGDTKGAWMPSVLQVGNEIHMYYSTGISDFRTPNLFRQRFNANGINKIGQPEKVTVANFANGDQLHNVDVKTAVVAGKNYYLMVANDGSHRHIRALTSLDGLNFTELANPLLSANDVNDKLITPHLSIWSENATSAPMGVASSLGTNSSHSVFVQLDFTRYGSNSAYEFRKIIIPFSID